MSTTIADLVVKIGADITGFKNSVKQLENEFSGIVSAGEKMKGIGSTLSLYVTAPILAAAGAALKLAVDVDKGVGEVVTLFGVTGDAAEAMADRLKDGVSQVSNEVGIAQSAITDGLYDAISAGIPEENVFDFLTIAAQASVAGVTDIATAVDGITTSINAYGLSAGEAQRVSDSMFAAVQGGKTTFEELSNALFNVAPTAAGLGIDLETINAALATLTAAGVPTSVASNYLKAALGELGKEGTIAAKEFKNLSGQSFPDFIKAGGSVEGALKLLQKGAEESNRRISDLFGSQEAGNAVMILATTGAEKFANELDRQAKSAGATKDAFALMEKTTSAQFQKTITMIQNIAIGIGDKILPPLNSFLGFVQDMILWFNNLNPIWQTAIGIIAGIAAAIGPVLYVLGSLVTLMPTVAAGFALLTGPIGLAVLGITAIATAVYLIYDNWSGIIDWFEDTWYNIKMVHLIAASSILDAIKPILDWIPGGQALYAGLSETINNAIDGSKIEREAQLAERAVDAAATEAERLASGAVASADGLEAAGTAGTGAGADIVTAMGTAVTAVETLGEQVSGIMNTLVGDISQGERVLAFKVELTEETALQNKITALQTALTTLATDTTISINDQQVIDLQTELGTAQTALDAWKNAEIFKTGLEAAFNTLKTNVNGLTTTELANLQTKVGELATQARTPEDFKAIVALNSSLDAALTYAGDTEQGITDMLDIADAQDKSFTALLDFQQALGDISSNMTGEDALQAKIAAVWAAVGDGTIPLEEGEQLVKDYNDEFERTRTLGGDIITGIGSLVKTHFPSLASAFDSAKTAVGDFKSAFKGDNDKSFLENIGNGFGNVADAINETKGFMNEFGTASGLVLGAISVAAPGLGAAITGLSAVFEALGIDVTGALNSISDAVAGLFNQGNNVGPLNTAFAFLNSIYGQLMERLTSFGASGQSLTDFHFDKNIINNLLSQASDYDDFIRRIAEYFEISTSAAAGLFDASQSNQIKQTVWPGIYDPNTGQTSAVSPELQAQIMAALADLQASGNFTNQEIYDILKSQFTKTPLITLGIPGMLGVPALAQGGLVFGPTMALVGDNKGAGSDPEVVSPLSKLNDMLVKPTLAAISSMMIAGGGSQQVIYVTLDGRVLAESAFYNLPDVIRMNTGGQQ